MKILEYIIPVIDVKGEKAVFSDKGHFYEKITGGFFSENPIELASYLKELGFREIFISDLDGILHQKPNLELVKEIWYRTGLKIMLDLGVWDAEKIGMIEYTGIKPVIATETFCSLNIINLPKNFVLCIDTRDEKLQGNLPLKFQEFLDLIKDSKNVKEVLIIDLDRVSISRGPNLKLCVFALTKLVGKKIIYGGGVRNFTDVMTLRKLGIHKVLVGSALYEGRISQRELKLEI
ncbi:MAG TPA: hypothetical protein ENG50_04885 [Candidatus Altiarchaeales archaeon]|nr:hypothetical protein [Candidatus Altiarchaeales archaeon]